MWFLAAPSPVEPPRTGGVDAVRRLFPPGQPVEHSPATTVRPPQDGQPTAPFPSVCGTTAPRGIWRDISMNSIIYLVGLVVIVLAILSFLGIR